MLYLIETRNIKGKTFADNHHHAAVRYFEMNSTVSFGQVISVAELFGGEKGEEVFFLSEQIIGNSHCKNDTAIGDRK